MAKRKKELLAKSADGKRAIYIDTINKTEIIEYIRRSDKHQKKIQYIVGLILNGTRNTEVYDKEDINEKCKNVTAMKLFKGGTNDRIYCKVLGKENNVHIIVAAILYEKKKSEKNTSREISIIETVASYEYE